MKSAWITIAVLIGVVTIVFVVPRCGKQHDDAHKSLSNVRVENIDGTGMANAATQEDINSAAQIARIHLKREGIVCAIATAL